jgi:hypothetical protein
MRLVTTAARIPVLVVATTLSIGCPSNRKVGQFKCSDFTREFFWQPPEVQMVKFTNYDLDKQYALFICGNQEIHPPAIYLAKPFAREGVKAIDYLRKQLSLTYEDLVIRDIIFVFEEMERQRTYDIAHDDELLQLMATRVTNMKDPGWRETSLRSLQEIQK